MSTVHWHYSYSIDSYICVRYAMMFNCFLCSVFLFFYEYHIRKYIIVTILIEF